MTYGQAEFEQDQMDRGRDRDDEEAYGRSVDYEYDPDGMAAPGARSMDDVGPSYLDET